MLQEVIDGGIQVAVLEHGVDDRPRGELFPRSAAGEGKFGETIRGNGGTDEARFFKENLTGGTGECAGFVEGQAQGLAGAG